MKTRHDGYTTAILDKEIDKHLTWEQLMEVAVYRMLRQCNIGHPLHIVDTPKRVVRAYKEAFAGVNANIEELLGVQFPIDKSEMVIVQNIHFHSSCKHHLLAFFGKAHFGYLPDKSIVGLSKIPRLIQTLAKAPLTQEELGNDIVNKFQEIVKPKGCGVVLIAEHMCMSIRGVKVLGATTRTNSLAGSFIKNQSVKQEFLEALKV